MTKSASRVQDTPTNNQPSSFREELRNLDISDNCGGYTMLDNEAIDAICDLIARTVIGEDEKFIQGDYDNVGRNWRNNFRNEQRHIITAEEKEDV